MFIFPRRTLSRALLVSTTLLASAIAFHAAAQTPPPADDTTDVSDGQIKTVIVKAERSAAANAPSKASVDATQPQSIISRPYIELAVPETGDFTSVVNIAPSISGTQGNGDGYGDAKVTLRGFGDGNYNVTYDGISYGDTNDPTHHSNTFFPASTIGAVIVDRGPGAAGDLGQANFGGAIHMFSNKVNDDFSFTQKLSVGSFNSWQAVSILQTGRLDNAGGLKLLINYQARKTDGALSYFGLKSDNISVKGELPISDNWNLSVLYTQNFNYSHQPDSDGVTLAQTALYGKNFYMNNDPSTPQYYKYNNILKRTNFGYIRLNGDLGNGYTLEDTAYTYFYSNKTISALDVTGATTNGPSTFKSLNAAGALTAGVIKVSGAGNGDVPGYDKFNYYDVMGNIVRLNKAFSFGTLKVGALAEISDTFRHRYDLDLNYQGVTGNMVRDPREKACTGPTTPIVGSPAVACPVDDKSVQYDERSWWTNYQLFADFVWTPTDKLTITPGLKTVQFTRFLADKVKSSPLSYYSPYAKDTFSKTLEFLTVNYKLQSNWSLYGQYATGFLMPPLKDLYGNDPRQNVVEPQTSTNYQVGTVYNGSRISIDADLYQIDFKNKFACTALYCYNQGGVQYKGIEGQFAYAFDFGLTAFVNGSLNSAKDNATHLTIGSAPKDTLGFGGIYRSGDFKAAVTHKHVGEQWANDGETSNFLIKAYDTTNLNFTYDFGRVSAKLSIDNVLDRRSVTKISPVDKANAISPYDQYFYQAPRNIMLTLSAKY